MGSRFSGTLISRRKRLVFMYFIRIPAGGQFRALANRFEPSTNSGFPVKRALPVAEPFSFPYGWNQYFRVSPFCSEKYVARSCMSVSDRACA